MTKYPAASPSIIINGGGVTSGNSGTITAAAGETVHVFYAPATTTISISGVAAPIGDGFIQIPPGTTLSWSKTGSNPQPVFTRYKNG